MIHIRNIFLTHPAKREVKKRSAHPCRECYHDERDEKNKIPHKKNYIHDRVYHTSCSSATVSYFWQICEACIIAALHNLHFLRRVLSIGRQLLHISLGNLFPVHDVPEVFDILRPSITIIDIVSMFPDIAREKWYVFGGDWSFSI